MSLLPIYNCMGFGLRLDGEALPPYICSPSLLRSHRYGLLVRPPHTAPPSAAADRRRPALDARAPWPRLPCLWAAALWLRPPWPRAAALWPRPPWPRPAVIGPRPAWPRAAALGPCPHARYAACLLGAAPVILVACCTPTAAEASCLPACRGGGAHASGNRVPACLPEAAAGQAASLLPARQGRQPCC